MDNLFLAILNMSLTGAFVIVAIFLARLPLKKAPKIISYYLWAIAGFRLVFPFSIESIFSLIPFNAKVIPSDIAKQAIPQINSGIPYVNSTVSSMLPAATPYASANPLQIWIVIGAFVWVVGVAVMSLFGVVSFFILKQKLKTATHTEKNIYEAKNIKSPFVLGIFKPQIYLPIDLSGQERSYIILHEQTHICRHDHIVKFVAYFILCLHWFNLLAWVAFLLMGVDMEMSCDERVLKEMGGDIKKDYSLSLLSFATGRRFVGGSPLAFGEGGIKRRIKNVLNYKKTSRVILVVAVALVTVLSIGFGTNRIGNSPLVEMKMVYEDNPAAFFKDMKLVWNDNIYHVVTMDNPKQGKEIGYATDETSTWRIYELIGYDHNYLLAVESADVWRVMSIYPPEMPLQQYILENATDKQRFERLLSVTLYNDGTVNLAAPPISSYLVPPCTYSFIDNELVIYTNTEMSEPENTYGAKSSDAIARFTVAADGTLVFKSSTMPLFADEGARYVKVSGSPAPTSDFKPREWVNYENSEDYWTVTFDMVLDEFPGVMFSWTSGHVTAIDNDGEKQLIYGMPIWNVYLADLNGDGMPEFCATISIGSGIIDTRIVVYDYTNDKEYVLADRMTYDYALSMEDGQLNITQTEYISDSIRAIGSMAIIDNELVVFWD